MLTCSVFVPNDIPQVESFYIPYLIKIYKGSPSPTTEDKAMGGSILFVVINALRAKGKTT